MLHSLLRSIPIFRSLSDDELREVAGIATEHTVTGGGVLFRQGEPGDALWIVISGAVRLFSVEQGHELVLGVQRPGEYFGEMSLMDGAPRSATAAAVGDTQLVSIGRADYLDLLGTSRTLLTDTLGHLSKNLRASNTHRFGLVHENEQIKAEGELDRLRSLSQMVAGVAHEINTPLGIIQNAATLVNDMLTSEALASLARDAEGMETLQDVAEACRLIQRHATNAAKLVLSFKSLSVRQIAETREDVDLLQVINETVDLFRFKARAKALSIRVECTLSAGDRQWTGYPGYLSQIILNFLTNVDRYAYPEGTGGDVEVVVRKAERPCDGAACEPRFEVVVRDHGKGIPEADLKKVWDPFFTTGRAMDGTGLGLAIVYNLVTGGLTGTVHVESSLGEGSAFTIGFPRAIPEGTES